MRRGAAWVNDQVKRSPSKPFLRWSALAALALAIPMAWLAPNQSTGAHQARPKSRPAAGHGKAAHKHGDHKRATRHRTAVEPSGGHGMPSTARSQYLKTTHSSVLNRMGCAEGRRLSRSRDESAIVVLAFGRPVRRGHGHWGASLFGRGFRSTGQIQRAAQAYARGFAPCAAPSGPHLTVAIGTSNFGPGVTYRHGAAWAAMVNGANEWVDAQELAHRVRFAGASDIELSWNGPRTSERWVRGYDSVARWPYYDYGDAAGCPPRGNCLGAWTQEDVWFVSWGARSAWPLPEIYTGDRGQAEQWYRLSLYSYLRHGWRMTIAGALSQRTACRQSSDTCRGMNNSPARAWGQLDGWLNRDFRTAQRLRWSSDFAWAR